MNYKVVLAHLAMFTVSAIYAANFSLAKIAMPTYIQPFGFILLRAIAGTTLFWISSLIIREKVPKKDVLRLALCGLFGVAINQLMFFKGLDMTTPINGSLIMLTTPILVLIFSVIAFREPIGWMKIVGVALGLGGAFLLITSNASSNVANAPNPTLGNIFVAINAAAYGVYLILVKPLTAKYHPITLLKYVFGFGLLYILPFGYYEATQIQWETFPLKVWWVLAFVLFGVTFLAYLLNAAALTIVKPSVVSSYIYLQPLLASLIAVALGSDRLNSILLFAGGMIALGVFMVSYRKKKLA
jgi:drug/metabolite transporter (DMT)-like permease